MARNYVILVPGLADKTTYALGQRSALFLWRTSRVRAVFFKVHWARKQESYTHKLERLLNIIDHAHSKGYTVSLMGASAGASMALHAFYKRPDAVHRVVSICGKLHHPETVPEELFALNPAFKESMAAYARIEPKLTRAERRRVLVVRATRDSYVPHKDGVIDGAHTYTMHSMGHVFSIMMALTIFRRRLVQFITKP